MLDKIQEKSNCSFLLLSVKGNDIIILFADFLFPPVLSALPPFLRRGGRGGGHHYLHNC